MFIVFWTIVSINIFAALSLLLLVFFSICIQNFKLKNQKIICKFDSIYFPKKKYWQKDIGSTVFYNDISSLHFSKGYDKNDFFATLLINYKDNEGDYTSFLINELLIGLENMIILKDLLVKKADLKQISGVQNSEISSKNYTFRQHFEKIC